MSIQYLGEIVLLPHHNAVGVCNQVTFLILYYPSSRLIPLLHVINAPIVITICFIPLLVDRYYDRLLPLSRQCLLIPNGNNKFMNRTANCATPLL